VLDEATSALDNRTEHEVINALEMVGRRCTTVVIAHRLSTIARCDRIYEFDQGVIKASGSFEELRERSDTFRELARLERFSPAS
jgi:ATP-binding cassette subfamily B protein